MRKLKIAVYTIALNESQFVKRFMSCVKDEADYVFVSDTGSTDDTVKLLREEGAHVTSIKVDPWRFDIPRNISMAFIPADCDICVCIDLDEILSPGWRDAIEASWTPTTDRLRYLYIWNMLPNGSDGISYWYDKIMTRKNFRWVKPVHEVMAFYGDHPEIQTYCPDFKLRHFPDSTKSRGSYLGLLEMGCREEPEDDRNCHYLGREYMYYGQYDNAINELKRHLSLPRAQWDAERAASMRYIARCHVYKGEPLEATKWFTRAVAEAPGDREPWVELGQHLYNLRDHVGAFAAMSKAIAIENKPMSYICEPSAWGSLPWDIAGVCAAMLGLDQQAYDYTKKAHEFEPDDPRIKNNLHLATEKLK